MRFLVVLLSIFVFSLLSLFLSSSRYCSASAPSSEELLKFLHAQHPSPASSASSASSSPSSSIPPELRQWLNQIDFSRVFKLDPISSISIPIKINLILLGFDGSGNLHVNIPENQMIQWFSSLPPFASLNELSSLDLRVLPEHSPEGQIAIEKANEHEKRLKNFHKPITDSLAASIGFRFHYEYVHVDSSVLRVLERVMANNWRMVEGEKEHIQINPEAISFILRDLLAFLNLHQSYSIFVLNPSVDWLLEHFPPQPSTNGNLPPSQYGYRMGLSDDEFDEIHDKAGDSGEDEKDKKKKAEKRALKSFIDSFRSSDQRQWAHQSEEHQMMQELSGAKMVESEEHADLFMLHLNRTRLQPPKSSATEVKNNRDYLADSKAWGEELLKSFVSTTNPQPLSQYLDLLKESSPSLLRLTMDNPYAIEECLTEHFVGLDRFVFLDLSADSFFWGPIIGGEGLKTNTTFPSVFNFASLFSEEERSEVLGEPVEDSKEEKETQQAIEAELVIVAERLLELKCEQDDSSEECQKLIREWDEMNELQKQVTKMKADRKVPSLEGPTAFSFVTEPGHREAGVPGHHDISLESEHFLGHLSSSVQGAIESVITPTVLRLPDSLTSFYSTEVVFNLYLMKNHQAFDPLESHMIARLRNLLEQLRLPSQRFAFNIQHLEIDDEPRLAMVFNSALKSAVLPTLLYDGHFASVRRLFLDSATLERDLLSDKKFRHESAQARRDQELNTAELKLRHINVFLFSMNMPIPVLIDRHFQAVPLTGSSSIVAIQNGFRLWESPIQCNRKPVIWNLRDPTKAIAAAAASVLGGVLPTHVKYSQAHQRVTQDWSWSVGSSPLSLLSPNGHLFNYFQRDALHRHYSIAALQRVTEAVNGRIFKLKEQKTTKKNAFLAGLDQAGKPSKQSAVPAAFTKHSSEIQQSADALQSRIKVISLLVESLQFDSAAKQIAQLYDEANQLISRIDGFIRWNEQKNCEAETDRKFAGAKFSSQSGDSSASTGGGLGILYYLVAALACLIIIIQRILRPQNDKPKFN